MLSLSCFSSPLSDQLYVLLSFIFAKPYKYGLGYLLGESTPSTLYRIFSHAFTDNTPRSYPTTSSWESKIRDHLFSLDDIIDDHEPRFRHDKWRNVFENQVSSTPITAAFVGGMNSLFSLPLGEDKVKWTVWLEKEALWKRLRTLSHVAVLEGEKLKVSVSLICQ